MRIAKAMAPIWIAMILFGLFISPPACALDSGSLAGLGGIGSPRTGEADDVLWNPASLGETDHRFQFWMTPASVRILSDCWSAETVVALLSDSVKPERQSVILAQADEMGVAHLNVGAGGGAHGAWNGNSLGVTVRADVQGSISADGVRLLLAGSQPGQTYSLVGTGAEGAVYGQGYIGSVYSDPWLAERLHITGFHMGGTLGYVHGLGYGRAEVKGSTVEIGADGDTYRNLGDGRVVTTHSDAGLGVFANLGLLFRLTPQMAVDVGLVDLGRIWWRDVTQTEFEFHVDPESGSGTYEQVHRIPSGERPFTNLPLTVRAGLSLEPSTGVRWSLQYARKLVGPSPARQEIALASELTPLEALPLRLGVKYSSHQKLLSFSGGVGLRLGPLTLDIGSANLLGLLGQGKEASVSVSTGMRF